MHFSTGSCSFGIPFSFTPNYPGFAPAVTFSRIRDDRRNMQDSPSRRIVITNSLALAAFHLMQESRLNLITAGVTTRDLVGWRFGIKSEKFSVN